MSDEPISSPRNDAERLDGESADPNAERPAGDQRLGVLKTYKLFVGGKFPRTESGRYEPLAGADGELIANVSRGSRKDFREAVVAARAAQSGWAGRSAYNRGQILYRIAEVLEGRQAQFRSELELCGLETLDAKAEVENAIDTWVHYAGWCDKFQQVFSTVNPVASSHFNFTLLEPTGVVVIVAPEDGGLSGLTAAVAPAIASGNTIIALASERFPLSAITFGEVLHTSDVPAGVVNLLTGRRDELTEHFASHLDVNAVVSYDPDPERRRRLQEEAVHNVKRVIFREPGHGPSPYAIVDTTEAKTTWHPIGDVKSWQPTSTCTTTRGLFSQRRSASCSATRSSAGTRL